MSASRTLLRKLKVVRDRMAEPENRRVKPGTPDRRLLWKYTVDGVEWSFHATKGLRHNRVPA